MAGETQSALGMLSETPGSRDEQQGEGEGEGVGGGGDFHETGS